MCVCQCLSVSVFVVCLFVHDSACTLHRKWWRYWFVNTLLLCVSVCVCMCLLTSVCPCQCLHGTSKVVAVLVRDKHADGPFSYGYGRCPVLIEYAGAALLALVTCSFFIYFAELEACDRIIIKHLGINVCAKLNYY